MSTASVPAPDLQAAPASQPQQIVNAFIAPSKTFSALSRNASWWMAWLLLSIVSMGFLVTVDKKIGYEEITRIQVSKNPRQAAQFEKLPPEQQAKQLQLGAKIARYAGYASPVLSLVGFLAMGAVLMATFNFALGAKVRFGVALAIVVYGSLPSLIKTLVAAVSLLAGANPEGFDVSNPIASNPAMLVDATQHKALYTLLTTFDIFSLWMVVLMGIGFAIQGKLKRSTGISVVLGWFLLVKLVSTAFAAL